MTVQEVASVADVETGFPREVAETFLRCKRDGFDQTNAIIELNALKIAEDRTFADCARYIFTTILGEQQVGLSLIQVGPGPYGRSCTCWDHHQLVVGIDRVRNNVQTCTSVLPR